MRVLVERALSVGAVVVAGLAVWEAGRPVALSSSAKKTALPPAVAIRTFDAESLAVAAQDATDRNLFREDRGEEVAEATPAAQITPRTVSLPNLTLRGIVGGPPWDAIVDGLPGHPAGMVVRDGESVGGFTVIVTARDAVRIKGVDTSWILVLRR